MTGDLDDDATTPTMSSFQSTVRKTNALGIPKDNVIIACHDNWDVPRQIFKLNNIKDKNGEEATIMKIAPVPFFVVQDGLDEDLDAGLVLERLQSIVDFNEESYLQHAAHFLKACTAQYPANQKKPALDMRAFTARKTKEDETWTKLRFAQFWPELAHAQLKTATAGTAQNPNDMQAMLKLLLDHKVSGLVSPEKDSTRKEEDEALDGSWEKKVGAIQDGSCKYAKILWHPGGRKGLFTSLFRNIGGEK